MKSQPHPKSSCKTRQQKAPIRASLVWTMIPLAILALGTMNHFRAERPPSHRSPEPSTNTSKARWDWGARTGTQAGESSPLLATALALLRPSDPAISSPGEALARLTNADLPLKDRREAIRALARLGSDEAIAGLKIALAGAPSSLKAAFGEALGESPHPEAAATLSGMLRGNDETAARGAIRGFALRGDAQAAETLRDVLFDAAQPESLRTEAALNLGDIGEAGALETLKRAASEITDSAIVENVLEGLGRRPLAETEEFFRDYLESPGRPAKLKAAALEALGHSEGDPTPLLLTYASNPNPDLRSAAAWALNTAEVPAYFGPQLADWLNQETSPDVRARLYRALANLDAPGSDTLLPLVQGETNPKARLAGIDLLAATCRATPTPDVVNYFAQTALPELQNTALTSEAPENRLAAVMSLQRLGTTQTGAALQEIARNSTDQNVVTAAQAALGTKPSRP